MSITVGVDCHTSSLNDHEDNILCSVEEFVLQKYAHLVIDNGINRLVVAARLTEDRGIHLESIQLRKNQIRDEAGLIASLCPTLVRSSTS